MNRGSHPIAASPMPFPTYKPSGVEWVGDVPEHWDVRRLRDSVLACVNGVWGEERNGLDDIPCVRVADFDRHRMRVRKPVPTLRAVASKQRVRRMLQSGDLLLEKSGGGDQQPVGVVILFDHDTPAVSSNFVARMQVRRGFDPAFLTFLHSVLYSIGLNTRSIKQTTGIQNLDSNAYLNESFAFPPFLEQAAIVRYLDHVDRRIRRYITAKRKLVALFEEERQAVVNQAVTRGLVPNVPLKPSGVEWLGDVPEHWELPRLRNLGVALIGLTYDPQDLVDEEEGMLVLRASNILNGQLVYGDNVYVSSAVPSKLITQEGDILICSRSGSRALIGKNARIDADSSGTTFGAFMTVFRGPNNDYLHQVFNSKFFEYQSAAFLTSTINQLTLGILYDMKVPFPSPEERQCILRSVEEATAPIIKAIAAGRRQIELVQEYRTRLIADVVTGKLDVREVVARLPDEDPIEEDGPLADDMDQEIYDAEEEPAIEEEVRI